MAARNYPADFRLQKFFTENYNLESKARLDFFSARKRGRSITKAYLFFFNFNRFMCNGKGFIKFFNV